MAEWSLYQDGQRKYITADERDKFYNSVSPTLEPEKKTFALMLYWTGCRISEALSVQYQSIDFSRGGVVFKTLKRRRDVYRFVPLPSNYLEKLEDIHRVRREQKKNPQKPVWSFQRKQGWTTIKKVMAHAGIEGIHATPKGLRHSFVIAHQQAKTPENVLQSWLGWSSSAMFEVYGKALGEEERSLASVLWNIVKQA